MSGPRCEQRLRSSELGVLLNEALVNVSELTALIRANDAYDDVRRLQRRAAPALQDISTCIARRFRGFVYRFDGRKDRFLYRTRVEGRVTT